MGSVRRCQRGYHTRLRRYQKVAKMTTNIAATARNLLAKYHRNPQKRATPILVGATLCSCSFMLYAPLLGAPEAERAPAIVLVTPVKAQVI